jgi:hypothetical protein
MQEHDDHYYFGELGSLPSEPAEAPAPSRWAWTAAKQRFGRLFSQGCRARQVTNQHTDNPSRRLRRACNSRD